MCLAIPTRIVELKEQDQAIVEVGGVRQRISVALIDGPAVGDYVVVHVGFAISKLDPADAQRTLDELRAAS
jgi:hydrogenase expression/formation protein HypC